MATRVKQSDLAAQLRVHPSTVSLALRDSPEVSEDMRVRVKQLASRLRYSPNQIARSLRRRKTETLGVLFPYATVPFYGTMLDALDAEADERGLHLEVHFHQWSVEQESEAVRTLCQRQVEGIIMMAADGTSLARLDQSVPPGSEVPVVMFGRPFGPKTSRVVRGFVGTDIRAGSQELGQHLIDMGHRQIAILAVDLGVHTSSIWQRIEGLRAAIDPVPGAELVVVTSSEATFPRRDEWKGQAARQNLQSGEQLAEQLMDLSPTPTAVVTTDESNAHVLLARLSAHGLRVPEDISVACYGGTYLSEYGPVPLTVVRQPFEEIARHTIRLVTAEENHFGKRPVVEQLAPQLIVRESVARMAAENCGRGKTVERSLG